MQTVTYFSRPATETGALPAHGFKCSCGSVQTTSLDETQAKLLASVHLDWHKRRGH